LNQDIGSRAVRGFAWIGGGQVVRQAIGFATMIVLARLLAPDDFGLFAMTLLVAEFAQLITDSGFGSAIVQRHITTRGVLNACFWLNIAVAFVVSALMLVFAPAVADYYGRPELVELLWPMALNVVISAAMVVPQALLTMRLGFRHVVAAQTAGSLSAAVAAVWAAQSGLGYWALVLQPLVGNATALLIMMLKSGWRPGRDAQWTEAFSMVAFSGFVLAGSMVGFLSRSLPVLILGKVLGPAALALYMVSATITSSIITQVSASIMRVLFPTLSLLKDDLHRLRSAWLKCLSAVAAIILPAMAIVAVQAHDFMLVVLGPKWLDGVETLRWHCLTVAVFGILTTAGSVLLATGQVRRSFYITTVSAAVYGIAIWIGTQYGVAGAAAGNAAATIFANSLATYFACRAAGTSLTHVAVALRPWAVSAVLCAAAMMLMAPFLTSWPSPLRLATLSAMGLAVYLGVLRLMFRATTSDLWNAIVSRLKP
jgi:PST family polysaccharide transporter